MLVKPGSTRLMNKLASLKSQTSSINEKIVVKLLTSRCLNIVVYKKFTSKNVFVDSIVHTISKNHLYVKSFKSLCVEERSDQSSPFLHALAF